VGKTGRALQGPAFFQPGRVSISSRESAGFRLIAGGERRAAGMAGVAFLLNDAQKGRG
jgi:hypothetical protein